ncbi:PRC-barrel domain-containing protein [Bacteroides luti]|uniref:PRC-barrel domain-containing protein n=1 Tax=Bacteroides luti TaxID=1297750 RepID=A0A1M4USA2_9BACE|nr:CBS domain-containing protein [Bacteroides luti]SHE59555.1 PRC-barrel domain-containing protein [Bacteroides luti]
MNSFMTFYLSRVIGRKIFDVNGQYIGIVKDLLVNADNTNQTERPLVTGIKIKSPDKTEFYSFEHFKVQKINGKLKVSCSQLIQLPQENIDNDLYLASVVLDKQIVDLNGRKLVRVNDIRLVSVANGTFAVAVDIGIEGLLRRIGIAKPLKIFLSYFKVSIPAKFILWEDVEAIDFSNLNIKLSKSHSKLQTLHPSDLADIIEDLGKKASADVFLSLDEERAADVLEEMEADAQVHIIESLSIEKAADVLDKMPADEVADILNALEEEKAELLLNEMEKKTSEEVRELLDYPEDSVGSLMATEIISFSKEKTVNDVLNELREKKPEAATLYNLFVTDEKEVLIATVSLRDIVVSSPEATINEIMKPSPVCLRDDQDIDEIAKIVSKYNMLAIPVVDNADVLQGMVVIDDVIEDLINKRRTNK